MTDKVNILLFAMMGAFVLVMVLFYLKDETYDIDEFDKWGK